MATRVCDIGGIDESYVELTGDVLRTDKERSVLPHEVDPILLRRIMRALVAENESDADSTRGDILIHEAEPLLTFDGDDATTCALLKSHGI